MYRCNLLPPTSGQSLPHGDITHSATTHNITPYYGNLTVVKLVKSTTVLPCSMCPLLDHILSQFNPVHILTFFKWHFRQGLHSRVSKVVVSMSFIFWPFSLRCRLGAQWRTLEFCSGGVQQIQLRTEDRENGDLGAVAP